MRNRASTPLLIVVSASCMAVAAPTWGQSATHGFQDRAPSAQQIEDFCRSYEQLSGSQRKQYRSEYERYCERPALQPETTIIQPLEPQTDQQPPRQETGPEPEPEMAPEPQPQLESARPEPVIPEPEPPAVDLAGELRLDGSPARRPGERQGFRVTVVNRGEDTVHGNGLWARVFLSEKDASRRRLSGTFALPTVQHGQRVRIPGVPGPGQSQAVIAQVTLPATVEEGEYWWCVLIDERQAIEETDESNNLACARKVVALGDEQGSGSDKLSALFGSKVDELNEQSKSSAADPAGQGIGLSSVVQPIKSEPLPWWDIIPDIDETFGLPDIRIPAHPADIATLPEDVQLLGGGRIGGSDDGHPTQTHLSARPRFVLPGQSFRIWWSLRSEPGCGGSSVGSPACSEVRSLSISGEGSTTYYDSNEIADSGSMVIETTPGYLGGYYVKFHVRECDENDPDLRLCDDRSLRANVHTIAMSPVTVMGSYAPSSEFVDLISCPLAGFSASRTIRLDDSRVSSCLQLDRVCLRSEEEHSVQVDGSIRTREGSLRDEDPGSSTLVVRVLDDEHNCTRDLNEAYTLIVRPIHESGSQCVFMENVHLMLGWKYNPDLSGCSYAEDG